MSIVQPTNPGQENGAGELLHANPAISNVLIGDEDMARKGKMTEEIIGPLREAEVRIGQGETVGKICRSSRASAYCRTRTRLTFGTD